jgi:hypothetical protein
MAKMWYEINGYSISVENLVGNVNLVDQERDGWINLNISQEGNKL